ncbi:hypothetical protein HU200_035654 [Digitaria exilis]|uniref:Late embryogenesis abundant protein LEA-2 subgroup domain-containing protein n=1 Tax=Digitaria exilis TaxID=1010633 RepID=A0A835BHS2_9POAL|nr:hypothetical protein HU200_035654 [Digitaria exilis]
MAERRTAEDLVGHTHIPSPHPSPPTLQYSTHLPQQLLGSPAPTRTTAHHPVCLHAASPPAHTGRTLGHPPQRIPQEVAPGLSVRYCSLSLSPPPPLLVLRPAVREAACSAPSSVPAPPPALLLRPLRAELRLGVGVAAGLDRKTLQKPRGGGAVSVLIEGRELGAEGMMHAKSESDVTSLAASSPPRSPKRGGGGGGAAAGGNNYYVQSPSRESHDGGYKSSSMQATPVYNSPNESPSHPSYGRHSRSSSVSRFSGNLRKGGGERKALNDKGWPECNVIEEEGPYEDLAGDNGLSRRCQIILGFLTFVLLFTVFCLIIWGAARPYEPEVIVKSLVMDDFYAGEGTDHSGVPTKLLRRYYQPRKSHRMVTAVIHGEKVPLYGAGGSGAVPLTLDFDLTSRGYVIGKLVRVTHKVHVTCPVVVDAKKTKPIRFSKKACSVYKA